MKNELRVEFKNLRNQLGGEIIKKLSHQIFLNLKPILQKVNKTKFFVYNSFNCEVKTDEIIQFLIDNNKLVFLPKVQGENMVAIKIEKTTNFKTNKFGINEPVGVPENIDDFVAIVPCLAVDKKGNRLGYGGGFYDKFLKAKTSIKIAICYDFQVVDNIKSMPFDVPMDLIVTEKQVRKIK